MKIVGKEKANKMKDSDNFNRRNKGTWNGQKRESNSRRRRKQLIEAKEEKKKKNEKKKENKNKGMIQ